MAGSGRWDGAGPQRLGARRPDPEPQQLDLLRRLLAKLKSPLARVLVALALLGAGGAVVYETGAVPSWVVQLLVEQADPPAPSAPSELGQ